MEHIYILKKREPTTSFSYPKTKGKKKLKNAIWEEISLDQASYPSIRWDKSPISPEQNAPQIFGASNNDLTHGKEVNTNRDHKRL